MPVITKDCRVIDCTAEKSVIPTLIAILKKTRFLSQFGGVCVYNCPDMFFYKLSSVEFLNKVYFVTTLKRHTHVKIIVNGKKDSKPILENVKKKSYFKSKSTLYWYYYLLKKGIIRHDNTLFYKLTFPSVETWLTYIQ